MKMNFLSGVKPKSLLGRRLSNRYLSSDAFNSSGRLGKGKIRRLGSAFSGRRGLFEIKYTVMKVLLAVVIISLFIYAIPTFRYGIHRLLVGQFTTTTQAHTVSETLSAKEFYVAPRYLTTDKFIAHPSESVILAEGDIVVESYVGTPIGIVESIGSVVGIRLYSDPGFKNNLFIYKNNLVADDVSDTVEIPTASSTNTKDTTELKGLKAVLFEGSGYGEIIAKLPPQDTYIKVGDVVYTQTIYGPRAVAEISQVSEDASSGSTFIVVSAQLLVPPQTIYRVKTLEE